MFFTCKILTLLLVSLMLQERQLEACREQLQAAQRDYDYVKDQLTITQVSLSRCYNFNIGRKSEAR
jgi:hypothetical protein